MTRTQLQLDDDTYDALRRRAYRDRKSLSAVAREILRSGLGLEQRVNERYEFTFINSGNSGRGDISVHHDEALAEDFK